MANYNFWDMVDAESSKDRWIKLPLWSVSVLSKIFTSHGEFGVFVYLISCLQDDSLVSIASTAQGLTFCDIPPRSYYRAISKFKQLGLKKIGFGVYDLTDFVKTLSSLRRAGKGKNE